MAAPVRLLFFAGSARAGSYNKRVARLGATIAEANGIPATFLDLGDYPMPIYNGDLEAAEGQPDNAKKLKAVMEAHAGILIVSPEYNASITPLLKNTLDWVSHVQGPGEAKLQVYKTRVFALASASRGGMGGLRSLTTVRQVLELGLGALVLPDQFAVPRVHEAFGDDGHLKNKESQENFKSLIQKLARAAHVLHG
jgi:NAD(P)H-dependent FMN reductase